MCLIVICRKLSKLLVNYGLCGNYRSREARISFKHYKETHINLSQAQVSLISCAFIKIPRYVATLPLEVFMHRNFSRLHSIEIICFFSFAKTAKGYLNRHPLGT